MQRRIQGGGQKEQSPPLAKNRKERKEERKERRKKGKEEGERKQRNSTRITMDKETNSKI